MEYAGIVPLLRDQHQTARLLLSEAKFLGPTRRQKPIAAWLQYRTACSPGMAIPGMDSNRPVAATRYNACALELTPSAQAALSALIDDELARQATEQAHAPGNTTPPCPAPSVQMSCRRPTLTLCV